MSPKDEMLVRDFDSLALMGEIGAHAVKSGSPEVAALALRLSQRYAERIDTLKDAEVVDGGS